MKAVNACCAALDEMKSRIPDQRAEAEHPDTPGAWRAGEDGLHLCGALGVRHEAHVRPEHAAHQGMQRAVEKAFARYSQARHEYTFWHASPARERALTKSN